MALIDRIFRDSLEGTDEDYDGYISTHAFSAAAWFWAKGSITRAQLTAALGLDATDDAQLDELAAHYTGLTAEEKLSFHSDLEAAGILAESGLITRATYGSLLGLT